MKIENKRWLITLAALLLTVTLAIFTGISVNHMTISKKDNAETTKKSSEEQMTDAESISSSEETTPETSTEETKDTQDTKSSEPEESASALPNPVPDPERSESPIRALSDEELAALQEQYDREVKYYSVGPDNRDDRNRPVNCVNFDEQFSALSDKITVFNSHETDNKELSIFFVITEEYENNTAYILNKLAEKNTQATFFINRKFAEENPEIVERIIHEKHELGSLGSSSPDNGLASYNLKDQMTDMLDLQRYIEDNFDYSMTSFYFRCDAYSEASLKMAAEMGYNVRYYTIEYDDGSHTKAIDANQMYGVMTAQLHDSASLLLHNANAATLIMLPNLLNYAEEQGYKITLLH